jgi:hypothetical protein
VALKTFTKTVTYSDWLSSTITITENSTDASVNPPTSSCTATLTLTVAANHSMNVPYVGWGMEGDASTSGSHGQKTYTAGTYTLATVNYVKTHNSNGTGSTSVKAIIHIPLFDWYKEFTASGSLTTIAVAPEITSTPNFNIGSTVNIGIKNPQSKSCTIYIQDKNGNQVASKTITGTSTGNITPTASTLYSSIPNNTSGTYKVRLVCSATSTDITQNGGTYSITGNEKPTGSLAVVDTNKTLATGVTTQSLTGSNKKLIRYLSNATATLTANGSNYANLAKTSIIYNGSVTEATQSSTSATQSKTYSNVTSASFSGSTTDKRGLTSATITDSGVQLVNYVQLTSELEFYRNDETSNTLLMRGSGAYFNGSFGSQSNSLTFRYRYKASSSSSWSSWTTKTMTISGNKYSFDFQIGTNFDYQTAYDFQIEIYDKAMKITKNETAKPGIPILGLFEDFIEMFGEKIFYK